MGIVFREAVQELVDLCKGRTYLSASDWFYELFMNRTDYGCPKSVEEARERLQGAWWVEESELRQQILYTIHRYQYVFKKVEHKEGLMKCIGRALRDYLIYEQRILSRQTGWEQDYQLIQSQPDELREVLGLPVVFERSCVFDLFERYLIYLSHILGLPRAKMAAILLAQNRQVNRFTASLKTKMEGLHARTT